MSAVEHSVGHGVTIFSGPVEGVSLALLFRRAEQAIRQTLQSLLDTEDLLWEHSQIMALLHTQPGLRMSEIAEVAVIPAATLTRHMDKLVERALVVRRIDLQDKRRVVAALSPRGTAMAERFRAAEVQAEKALLHAWGDQRLAVLRRELALLPDLLS